MTHANQLNLLPLAARIALAGVFATAGVAKLAGRRAAARSFTEFGVPEQLSELAVSLLAVAELVLAVAVLPSATARFGALGIATLLTLFISVILWTLARGQRPACACFGQVRSEPIGPRILVRNSLLWVGAALVAWDATPQASALHAGAAWPDAARAIGSSSTTGVLALLALAGLALVSVTLVSVLRQYGKLLMRVERLERELGVQPDSERAGLPVGADAPAFSLAALNGGVVSLAHIKARAKTAILVFIEPGCGPCSELLPDIAAAQVRSLWLDASVDAAQPLAHTAGDRQSAPDSHTLVIVVTQGDARENRAKTAGLGVRNVLLQQAREVADAYKVVGTPSAVRITNGVVASALAAGPDAVRSLLNDALHTHTDTDAQTLGVGDDVPALPLRDVDGRTTDLRELTQKRSLLLFWSPACGYCQEMLADLLAWERRTDPAGLSLVVVSQGSPAANRDQGLRSQVVLDDTFLVGRTLGVSGTPSAILVDKGRVISGISAGASAVFRLATPSRVLATQS